MKDYTYRTFRVKGQIFSAKIYADGRIYVQSIHPYDETEYHWAWFPGREDDYWGIYRNGQFVARTRDFYDGADLLPEDVAAVLLDLDERAKLKPRMIHN